MKPSRFPAQLRLTVDVDLARILAEAAQRERTSISEVARRVLRAGLAECVDASKPRAAA